MFLFLRSVTACEWLALLNFSLALLLAAAGECGVAVLNLVGGFLVGVALAWLELRHDLPREWRLLIVTGFLGALTTFSTFSAEVVALLMRGHLVHAGGLAMVHLAGSLALTALGIGCVRALAG